MRPDPVSATAGALSAFREQQLASVSLGGLPRGLAQLPPADQARAVAGQFEAILLRQFLQESVGRIMGGESGGPTGSIYGYLLTDVLANQFAAAGGLGLGRLMARQLSPPSASPSASLLSANPSP